MKPRIAAITRADACGLGTLSRMFAEHLGFYRTVSIARHKGGAFHEWYGENNRVAPENGLTPELVAWLCEGADVLFSFECWYGEFAPRLAKDLGVKTALMPMYECCPETGSGLEHTDLALCPSLLDLDEMKDHTPALARAVKTYIPVPFDIERIPFRRRERALVFVHNAGHGGLGGRNSTQEVLEAWQYVHGPARLLVRVQPGCSVQLRIPNDSRISAVESNPENYWDLFSEGDVLLHPHKWDGLSLPIQEATAAGMPVMTTRYFPFCSDSKHLAFGWMPKSIQDIAIEPVKVGRQRICRAIDVFYPHPKDIAKAVDKLYGEDISAMSFAARAHAEKNSWAVLGPLYEHAFETLVKGD